MFHKNVLNSFGSNSTFATQTLSLPNAAKLTLVPAGGGPSKPDTPPSSALLELLTISSKKCSSFLAEAAVLVLVFALLDRMIVKEHIGFSWVAGALGISLALLAGSIALDFSAKRWLAR